MFYPLNRLILNQAKKTLEAINEENIRQQQYLYDKERIDFQYQQIMQMRRKYEEAKNNNRK